MNSDDLTRKVAKDDEEDKNTQPTITAVFRLIQDVETRLTARVTEVNTRVTEVNTRVIEGFKDLGHKLNALNRRILQSEADQEDLRERIERLESKAS